MYADVETGTLVAESVICKDCGRIFVYTLADRLLYMSMGFTHRPKRCPVCRRSRR